MDLHRSSYQPDLFPETFREHLPRYMACSDDLGSMVHLRRSQAMRRAYIAPNSRNLIWCDCFDIDRAGAVMAWEDAGVAMPNWTTQNPHNGHAHLGYLLAAPVPRTVHARERPQRLLARIEHAMTEALDADRAYGHLLTKTPMHRRWRTVWWRHEPYGLEELREYLPDNLPLRLLKTNAVGLGRNVTLFDALRAWAYRARLSYQDWPLWLNACRTQAEALNTFGAPLPVSEVRATAKSVAKWTWRLITSSGFSEVQRKRQARMATKRRSTAIDRRAMLLTMTEATR